MSVPVFSSQVLPPAAGGLPRVLPPAGSSRDLAAHQDRLGRLPRLAVGELTRVVQAAGLTGRGGAAFPTFRKIQAVAAGRRGAVVVANGAEGEPASGKDHLLLRTAPQLVLDGLQLLAAEVRAERAYLYLPAAPDIALIVDRALAERTRAGVDRYPVRTVTAPDRFIAGEESAVVNRLAGGDAVPRSTPPRVFERGVRGRPTLVSNVETLAHLALIARFGERWFRTLGTPAEPGSMLLTLGGAVRRPGVCEAAFGASLPEVVDAAGGATAAVGAVLVGGYHGAWLPAGPGARLPELQLCNSVLRPAGAGLGAGVVTVLAAERCGLVETARVASYLAGESARQCGPCLNGLPRLAEVFADLAIPGTIPGAAGEVRRLAGLVERRGACHHPDGTTRLLRSALRTFAGEVDLHVRGRCSGPDPRPVLPTPAGPVGAADPR